MKRVAITICLNAREHLCNTSMVERLIPRIDRWVFVEGAAGPGGSTSWCRPVDSRFQRDGHSVDGTVEYLDDLQDRWGYPLVTALWNLGPWGSKDLMVNAALEELRGEPALLWQIDADERWTAEQMDQAEEFLMARDATRVSFCADFFVGAGLVARGEWGEARFADLPDELSGYRRLWRWDGERMFESHEPPILDERRPVWCPDIRFQHFAYVQKEDVDFKSEYYADHAGVLQKWRRLQTREAFPAPISELLPEGCAWGSSKTTIERWAGNVAH